ncbi:MAG: hypothetical protein E7L40_12300 [Corynebacterium kroppenstedtii]|nr:hypothetical protein [Corynebacterium kroppenstedtii]
MIPELVAFDLDDTLAPSKTRLPQEMARIIVRLLDRTSVCVISGGQFGHSGDKKLKLREAVAGKLLDLEVRAGGSTSVDITRVGRDKSFGIAKLLEMTGLSKADVLFYGDRLDEHGNDYPVKAMGIPCVAVDDWHDTLVKLEDLLSQA